MIYIHKGRNLPIGKVRKSIRKCALFFSDYWKRGSPLPPIRRVQNLNGFGEALFLRQNFVDNFARVSTIKVTDTLKSSHNYS